MAYKISYETTTQRKSDGSKPRLFWLTVCFFLLFVFAAHQLLPEELEQLRQLFFPKDAVEALLQDLREGHTISEAVDAFCQEIDHAR